MKAYCVYTPAHEVLYREWFLPRVPEGIEVRAQVLEIAGAGDFLSPEFLRCIREKIARVVASIDENAGEWIVWTDIDILYSRALPQALAEVIAAAGQAQVLFQRERRWHGEVNTGFIVMKCDGAVRDFFLAVGRGLEANPGKNEQAVINEMLSEGVDMEWDSLPEEFVARTHGWPPRRPWVIYHANFTVGVDGIAQKVRQFRMVEAIERIGWPAVLWAVLVRTGEKLREKAEI